MEELKKEKKNHIGAFHCRCLRSGCRIPHAMLSHISNVQVLETAGAQFLASLLEVQQILLYGRIASQPHPSFLRASVFEGDNIAPRSFDGARKRGRPRMTWASVQHAKALQLFQGSQAALNQFFVDKPNASNCWKILVKGSL